MISWRPAGRIICGNPRFVHRGRLVNLKRVVALEWRAAGDFELRLDSGATFAGSRRFKAAVARIAA